MSACDTCAFDGGDPGNLMAYVYCLLHEQIMLRLDDCEHYVDEDGMLKADPEIYRRQMCNDPKPWEDDEHETP